MDEGVTLDDFVHVENGSENSLDMIGDGQVEAENEDGAGELAFRERIMGVLGPGWMTVSEVHGLVPDATLHNVYYWLRMLESAGDVEVRSTVFNGRRMLVYRRAGAGSAPPVPRESVSDGVLEVLGPDWMTVRDVQGRIPDMSFPRVQNFLGCLAARGDAEVSKTVMDGHSVCVYRRAGSGPAPPVPGGSAVDMAVDAVVEFLGPEWTTFKEIRGSVPAGMTTLCEALNRAIADGRIERGKGLRNGRLVTAYRLPGASS